MIRRALAGEGGAFTALHAAHAGRVRAYLLRSGLTSADADDLAQEVFLRAFRSLATYDAERGPFAAWLGAVARNVVRRHWSRRSRGELFDPELAEEMFPADEDPASSPEAMEEIEAIGLCVDALPSALARLVRLRYVDGRTTRGVAEAAGMPESTVRARLAEARDLLARCLREKGIHP